MRAGDVHTRYATCPDEPSPAGDELPAWLGRGVLEACAVPMILFEHGPAGCVVRYVNPAFTRRTGYCTAEIARMGWDGLHVDGGRAHGLGTPPR